MTYARTVVLALGAVLLTAAPALAQTGLAPLPGTRLNSPSVTGTPSPTLSPAPPVGVPTTVDPRTGLPSGQLDSRTGLPSDTLTEPRTGLPSSSPGVFSIPTPPPTAPLPVPLPGPPRTSPPAGQPITPSTVDPRTGLPR